MESLEAENRALRDQIEEMEKNAPDMAKLDKHFRILEDDKRKFEDYNQNVQGSSIWSRSARFSASKDSIS
jgi:kinetochore protein NDC80